MWRGVLGLMLMLPLFCNCEMLDITNFITLLVSRHNKGNHNSNMNKPTDIKPKHISMAWS